METYFNLNYEFDRVEALASIGRRVASGEPGYVCVADGVILNNANRKPDYLATVNGSMFCICDSSYVPLYLRWLYGIERVQYSGSEIFRDIVSSKRYRMAFLGTNSRTLEGLRSRIVEWNPAVASMTFTELPFCEVDDFDYPAIAAALDADGAEIIWVALGAPKQERFMERLLPHLRRGVMIAVGAAFNFYSGIEARRAPQWMVRNHLEFVYRISCEPGKQLRRCGWIVVTLPWLLAGELRRKRRRKRKNTSEKQG